MEPFCSVKDQTSLENTFLMFLLGLKHHSFSCSFCNILSYCVFIFRDLFIKFVLWVFFNDTASNFLILSFSAKDQMSTFSSLRHYLNTLSTQLLR